MNQYQQSLLCGCGRWSSTGQSMFCAVCSSLKCQHPLCTAEVVELGYCSGCGRITPAYELSKATAVCLSCICCGRCGATITQRPSSQPGQGAISCGFCGIAGSRHAALESTSTVAARLATAMKSCSAAHAAFLGPMDMPASVTRRRKHGSEAEAYSIVKPANLPAAEPLERAVGSPNVASFLELGEDCWTTNINVPRTHAQEGQEEVSKDGTGVYTRPACLVPLFQRRCLSCSACDRPGILVSANPSPFATIGPAASAGKGGVAGLTWGKAKWYRKDCSASLLLPRVDLLQMDDEAHWQLKFTNPTDLAMRISFSMGAPALPSSSLKVDPHCATDASGSVLSHCATSPYHFPGVSYRLCSVGPQLGTGDRSVGSHCITFTLMGHDPYGNDPDAGAGASVEADLAVLGWKAIAPHVAVVACTAAPLPSSAAAMQHAVSKDESYSGLGAPNEQVPISSDACNAEPTSTVGHRVFVLATVTVQRMLGASDGQAVPAPLTMSMMWTSRSDKMHTRRASGP